MSLYIKNSVRRHLKTEDSAAKELYCEAPEDLEDNTAVLWGSTENFGTSGNIVSSCEIIELVVFGLDKGIHNGLARIEGSFLLIGTAMEITNRICKRIEKQMKSFGYHGLIIDGV
eukprot:UN32574